MQGFGAQTHLFSEVAGHQQFEQTRKKCPMDIRKLLTPFLFTPPPEGLLNNANHNVVLIALIFDLSRVPRLTHSANFSKLSHKSLVSKNILEPPISGRQNGVTPICFDFPVSFRFVPLLLPYED